MLIVRVAAAVICENGRYLIARRKSGVHLGGLWEFPGGKCKPGESLEDCLRRELQEELAVTIANPVRFRTVRHDYPGKSVELNFFRCTIAAGRATAVGCAEVRWVLPEELPRFEFPPADRPVIEALVSQGGTV